MSGDLPGRPERRSGVLHFPQAADKVGLLLRLWFSLVYFSCIPFPTCPIVTLQSTECTCLEQSGITENQS